MQCFLNDERGKITPKDTCQTHPKTKSRNRMAWILRNLSHFDFFPKNLKKGLTSRSGCDIIKAISNSRKECERRNIYLKVE